MKNHLTDIFRSQSDTVPDWQAQRESWVQDVTGLMTFVIVTAAVVIAIGTLADVFAFKETLPIYILLILVTPAWWGAKHGGWHWAGYFPALLCISLGIYSSLNAGFVSIFVLFYALSVLLAVMLLGSRMGLVMVILCTLAYTGLGLLRDGFSFSALAHIVTFFFGLVGILLLQTYSYSRLQKILKAQAEGSQNLQAEIARRQQAEMAQQEQETQLRRLADHTTDLVTEIDPNGILHYVSPSHLSGLGYAPETLPSTCCIPTTARPLLKKLRKPPPAMLPIGSSCACCMPMDISSLSKYPAVQFTMNTIS
jgi:PAS domain-containing protein